MKIQFSLLLLFVSVFEFSNAQPQKTTNYTDCKNASLCKHFFSSYSEQKKELIKNNWSDFFGQNLDTELPAPGNIKTISIKFDGMGCIYPQNAGHIQDIKKDFIAKDVKFKKFYKETFYHLFNQINQGKKYTSNTTKFITDLGFNYDSINQTDKKKDFEYFDFIKRWNQKFMPKKINEINNVLNSAAFEKIIFFIHGYNVPYSLAQIQGNELLNTILETDSITDYKKVLFIRVLWPSGSYKASVFDSTNCNYTDFEKYLPTGSAFTYFSNRAYLAALSLRQILNGVKKDIPIDIYTHSHGSTVATTLLIKTTSKLQHGKTSDCIKKLMDSVPLPNKKVRVFLNAASIPGVATFTNISRDKPIYSYYFFVGYNNNDRVLLKKQKKLLGIKLPGVFSSTTLGSNYKNEVCKVKKVFANKCLEKHFSSGINSLQIEHDFFCYIMQNEFKRNLKCFIDGKIFPE